MSIRNPEYPLTQQVTRRLSRLGFGGYAFRTPLQDFEQSVQSQEGISRIGVTLSDFGNSAYFNITACLSQPLNAEDSAQSSNVLKLLRAHTVLEQTLLKRFNFVSLLDTVDPTFFESDIDFIRALSIWARSSYSDSESAPNRGEVLGFRRL